MKTKRVFTVAMENIEKHTKKKVYAFSLDPELMTEFKRVCDRKYKMSQVVEEFVRAFVEENKRK